MNSCIQLYIPGNSFSNRKLNFEYFLKTLIALNYKRRMHVPFTCMNFYYDFERAHKTNFHKIVKAYNGKSEVL